MRRQLAIVVALLSIATTAVAGDDTGRYPADISPPPGTQYPCALTALPRELKGIPTSDRAYINRTYARILRATQAKLVVLKALDERRGIGGALQTYSSATGKLRAALRADAPPNALQGFHSDVIRALELQRQFFDRAAEIRQRGGSMESVFQLREGRDASARLMAAWHKMSARYPAWDAATKDSIYHHLCALDLF